MTGARADLVELLEVTIPARCRELARRARVGRPVGWELAGLEETVRDAAHLADRAERGAAEW
jgi:hypothetical protein